MSKWRGCCRICIKLVSSKTIRVGGTACNVVCSISQTNLWVGVVYPKPFQRTQNEMNQQPTSRRRVSINTHPLQGVLRENRSQPYDHLRRSGSWFHEAESFDSIVRELATIFIPNGRLLSHLLIKGQVGRHVFTLPHKDPELLNFIPHSIIPPHQARRRPLCVQGLGLYIGSIPSILPVCLNTYTKYHIHQKYCTHSYDTDTDTDMVVTRRSAGSPRSRGKTPPHLGKRPLTDSRAALFQTLDNCQHN